MEKNTRFLVLAGFSLSGPVGTPFILRGDTDPIEVLGISRLAENVELARQYGITPLVLRLNGSHGECVVNHDELNLPALQFKTLDATDDCNNIDIHLLPTHLIVKGLTGDITYYFADYKGIDALATAIKRDLYFGKGEVDVEVLNQVPLTNLCLAERYVGFQGADDGFNLVSNHNETDSDDKLQAQIQLLRDSFIDTEGEGVYFTGELSGFQIDTLVFTDIPYEKAPADLAYILGGFATAKTEEQSIFCSVVLCSDLFAETRYTDEGEDTYSAQIQSLLNIAPNSIEETSFLEHVEVVVGVQDAIYAKQITMPCAANYAFMRYALPDFYTSATNKALLSMNTLQSRELKQNEVANLSSSGYICIVPSIRKGFVPFLSKNFYPQNAFHAKPHYLRSVHYDVGRMAGFFNQYIGEPFNYTLFQSILTQVNSFKDQLLEGHPLYQNITIEVLDYTDTQFTLSIAFQLYGEVEVVRTSFEYVPSSEVNISWQ
ncbi:hypothetical protein [Priestia sp. YIM B13551]|uniref:hypothetical protein n=1 Tax=Priestia sp. YIM B13551 TaxID=3366306 RepID=UPI00366E1BE4